MNFKSTIAKFMPSFLLPTVERVYDRSLKAADVRQNDAAIDSKIAADFFDSESHYQSYRNELNRSPVSNWVSKAESTLDEELSEGLGNFSAGKRYYALVRKISPDIVIETGVRHGQSTLFILAALKMNERGSLISIDYPLREEEASDELIYRDPNAYIPFGKDPGWIIPNELTNDWKLVEGPSQRHLVDVLSRLDSVDIFIHDSDHSINCMLFEYEAAWPRLVSGGVLISDDIDENRAWDIFIDSKGVEKTGPITNNSAYAIKQPRV